MNFNLLMQLRGSLRKARKLFFAVPLMVVSSGCSVATRQRSACPTIEVSAVADAPSDSARRVVLDNGTKIALAPAPMVTSADVTGATASLTEGQWVLNVNVTDAGAKRVQDFSRQNVGHRMAFLVDGKVRSTPKILDPITGKGFLIGGFDKADAERLAAAINTVCEH